MPDLHHLAHAVLFAAYVATAAILLAEGALAHSGCALAIALVYVGLCLFA